MNLSEINWDLNAAGSWPNEIKLTAIAFVALLVAVGGFYFFSMPQLDEIEVLEAEEAALKVSFELKQKKAINLQDFKDQLAQIEESLGEMLKQMPTKAEVANLLVDISQTGLASGLEIRLFQPSAEIRRDFYSELPINIQVIGKYEELGSFISGLASLPRIVTVHDINMMPVTKDIKGEKDKKNSLVMSATIKTYNEGVDEVSEPIQNKRVGK